MTNPTKIRKSTTPGAAPASLAFGEIAINEADHRLFYRTGGGAIASMFLPNPAIAAGFSDSRGNLAVGTTALATAATDGFIYDASMPGIPTGTPTAYSGRVPLVYDTADDRLYVYNGIWRPVQFNPDTINIKLAGAKGDGVTDDTTAIQNALNSLSSTGGRIDFPRGTYLISATLNVPSGVSLFGAGQTGWPKQSGIPSLPQPSTIQYSASAAAGIMMALDPTNHYYTGTICRLTFDGGAKATDCIHVGGAVSALFQSITCQNYTGTGIHSVPLGTYQMNLCTFNNVACISGLSGTRGFYGECTENAFVGCRFQGGVNGTGCELGNLSDDNYFFMCYISGGTGASATAYYVHNAGFNNNMYGGTVQTEDALGTDVHMANNAFYSYFFGTVIGQCATWYKDDGQGYFMFVQSGAAGGGYWNATNFAPTPSIANGGNYPIPLNGGMVVVHDMTSNSIGTYMVSGGAGTALVSAAAVGTQWVPPTRTPGAGFSSVAFDGTSNNRIYNNMGSARSFRVSMLATG